VGGCGGVKVGGPAIRAAWLCECCGLHLLKWSSRRAKANGRGLDFGFLFA